MIDNITRLRRSFLIIKKEQINKKDYVIVVVNVAVVESYHREMSKLE